MKANFKKIQKQLYCLYDMLNAHNELGINRKQLFIHTIKENLSRSRRNNPLVLQLANNLAAAMLIIEEQKLDIKELEEKIEIQTEPPTINVLNIMNMLEAISEHDKSFHFPKPVKIRVMNPNDGLRYIEREFNPRWVVCIHSISKGYYDNISPVDGYIKPDYHRRMKRIIYKVENGKTTQFKCFILNSNDKLDKVSDIFDILNYYLCVVSKKSIVNVSFYDLSGNTLEINEDLDFGDKIDKIE
jgi:hypothetical protein